MFSKQLLVIDDEDVVREIVQGCFEDVAGWEVATAISGQEGLEKTLLVIPDAIILDLMMPGINGITFLQQLKANPVNPSIPVVLLTARADMINPKNYAHLGVVGAVAKPFDPIDLVTQVAKLLGWVFLENDASLIRH